MIITSTDFCLNPLVALGERKVRGGNLTSYVALEVWTIWPYQLRASPIIPGSASASRNEKWPPSRMQMQTQAKLPLILHSLLLDFRQRVNMNWLLLKLNRIICIYVLLCTLSINRLLLKLSRLILKLIQIFCKYVFTVHPKHQLVAFQTQPVTSQTQPDHL